MAGLATSLGSGAMTNSIAEIGDASTIFAIGTNTTQAHPVLALQVKKAARNGAKLIVANPKEIDLCRHATLHLQHRPGTDVLLIMGMIRVIIDEGLADMEFIKSRCENYDEFAASLASFDLDNVEKITGVSADLNSVWGFDNGVMYAAGAGGTLLRYGNGAWATVAVPDAAGVDLSGGWGDSESAMFVVGADGTVFSPVSPVGRSPRRRGRTSARAGHCVPMSSQVRPENVNQHLPVPTRGSLWCPVVRNRIKIVSD